MPRILAVDPSDPRLGKTLQRLCPRATTVGELIDHREELIKMRCEDDVRAFYKAIADSMRLTIENELIAIVTTENTSARNKKIVSDYYGFGGKPLTNLESVGRRYKITRERVRQICTPSRIRRLSVPPFAPTLDSALSHIHECIPQRRNKLEADLVRHGLIEHKTSIHSICRVARCLGRNVDFEFAGLSPKEWVLGPQEMKHLRRFQQIARTATRRSGAAQIDDVVDRSHASISRQKAMQIATKALSSVQGFRWLDRGNGWFWLDDGRSDRLRRRIRKVLAVCGQIDVAQLRAAIRRDYQMRGRVPPKSVVLEVCRQMQGVSVDGDRVLSTQRENPMDLVQGDEGVLVGLLRAHDKVCRREELFQLATRAGVSRPSFWRCIQFCPTISRYAPNVYGLTGISLPPGVIEEMVGDRRFRPVLQDHGWTDEKNIWIAYRLSHATIESGVVGVPAAKRELLQGHFTLTDAQSNTRVGELMVKKSSAWGLGPFFRQSGVEEGDYLLLEFNTSTRLSAISTGDESLIEHLTESC